MATADELRTLCSDMTIMKHRLGAAGLFKTMHAMDAAVKVIGFEVAEALPAVFARAAQQEADNG